MTFGEIQSQVAGYLNRTDLSSQIPIWINFTLRKIERQYNLNYMRERAQTSFVAQDPYITMPNVSYKETVWLKVLVDGKLYPLEKADPDTIMSLYPNLIEDIGRPKYFCYFPEYKEILVRPTPDKVYNYDHYYYKYSPGLSVSGDTNWITLTVPELLIWGTLMEGEAYLINDERIALWSSLFQSSLEILYQTEQREVFAGGYRKTKSIYVFNN